MVDELSERLRATGLGPECTSWCVSRLATVKNGERWVHRFDEILDSVNSGTEEHRRLDNHLFELKVLCHLVALGKGAVTYEPDGRPEGKNCDVLVETPEGRVYVELKAFHPTDKPKPIPFKYITPGNAVEMDPELYHHFQATRGHLMDVAFEVEEKLEDYSAPKRGVMAVLLDFYLDLESYRDFVALYRGSPRPDDPLDVMSQHALKGRSYKGTIDEFWGLPFNQFDCDFKPGHAAVAVGIWQHMDQPILAFDREGSEP